MKDYFDKFGIFSADELDEFIKLFEPRKLDKGDVFVKEGDSCKEVAFIVSGIFRSYYTTDDGVDNTFCFRFDGQMLAPYSALITGQPSVETMQAITSAELLVVPKSKIEGRMHTDPKWIKFLKIHAEYEYVELEKRYLQLQRDSASQRYHTLMQDQPEYIRQIPLHYLASYLGITQRHLSRIRKEMAF